MIEAILVDAGGILFNNVSEESAFLDTIARRHGVDRHRLAEALEERDAAYEVDAAHVHSVLTTAIEVAGTAIGLPLDEVWVDALYLDSVRSYPESFQTVSWLRQQRPDLVLTLANNEARHWDILKDTRYGHLGLFDEIGSSWNVGHVKPSPAYLEAVTRLCRCSPDRALLVDDNPQVVAQARQNGLQALYVASPSQLAEQLASILSLAVPDFQRERHGLPVTKDPSASEADEV